MPTSDWTPAVADVGAILRARTKDANGNEVGTFTADTRPTEEQVESLIQTAVGDIASEVGEDFDESHWNSAKRLAAIGTSLYIELSYFPEQVASGRSPYDRLKELYDSGLKKLEEIVEAGGEGVGVDDVGGYGLPSASFPEDIGGLVGWGTRF